ncbi:lipase atg [Salix suchowensis]|nr:lipase atg [Salix suchowensis]
MNGVQTDTAGHHQRESRGDTSTEDAQLLDVIERKPSASGRARWSERIGDVEVGNDRWESDQSHVVEEICIPTIEVFNGNALEMGEIRYVGNPVEEVEYALVVIGAILYLAFQKSSTVGLSIWNVSERQCLSGMEWTSASKIADVSSRRLWKYFAYPSDGMKASLNATSLYNMVQALDTKTDDFMKVMRSTLESTPAFQLWDEPEEVDGPDVENRQTLLELAKMTNNAYLEPDQDGCRILLAGNLMLTVFEAMSLQLPTIPPSSSQSKAPLLASLGVVDQRYLGIGHSLGGALGSLLGATFGAPVVTFESPGEKMAQRGYIYLRPQDDTIRHCFGTGLGRGRAQARYCQHHREGPRGTMAPSVEENREVPEAKAEEDCVVSSAFWPRKIGY